MIDNEQASEKNVIVIAQISDSHLFSDVKGTHHGHNVLLNLKSVLDSIRQNPAINYVIFTGDLTQDHSEQSYQHFVDAIEESQCSAPVYFLAGNHDEPALLSKYFTGPSFCSEKTVNQERWQIQLLDSKGPTPSGIVSEQALANLRRNVDENKHQLIMMHHHAIDVGYFIDQHGLENKAEFWQEINTYNNIVGIACGHVHRALELTQPNESNACSVALYTCPATSIQFDPTVDGVAALPEGPAYRLFNLFYNGQLTTEIIRLSSQNR